MSKDWRPGDVAMVQCSDGKWRQAGYLPSGLAEPQWVFADNARRWVWESDVRPLAVIDPEDREAVKRLLATYHGWKWDDRIIDSKGASVADMQAALREFANPKPPRPSEPTGLGAVVEDGEGKRWTRANSEGEWYSEDGNDVAITYAEVPVVRVLSEGVQP